MKTQELVRVTLQNEMDLILAHKRTMRLAEWAGLSLSAQTTFATAVSEVSRNTIDHGKNGCLILSVSQLQRGFYIIARITDEMQEAQHYEGLAYAKRLVDKYNVVTNNKETSIELYYLAQLTEKVDAKKVDEWRNAFRNESALSPYEEIKRKNEQLQDLAQRLKESEEQYRTLTNTLPLIIFTLDEKGALIFANKWLRRFTGASLQQLNASRWRTVVHPDDYDSFSILINQEVPLGQSTVKIQCRIRHVEEDDYYWHLASITPLLDDAGKLSYWIGYIVDINAQKLVEETLKNNQELKAVQQQLKEHQHQLEANVADLNRSNLELQQFAYIASHDLQEPARKVSVYSDYLISKCANVLDERGLKYLHNMQEASKRMRNLIMDLLSFAQVERGGLKLKQTDLNQVTANVLQNLEVLIAESGASVFIENLPTIEADEGMMHQLLENLIVNAIKYAKESAPPKVEIRCEQKNDSFTFFVKDNGIGFNEKYLPQMLTLFQRLHSEAKYEGTGLGLAICQKIVALHNGKLSAKSKEGEGAEFIITLPITQ